MPREQQGYTRCPGHREPRKRMGGIASGDLVRFRHPRHGVLTGYATLDKRKDRVAVRHAGRQVSVRTPAATLVARNTGYRVSLAENAA